ncbi:HAMP domain-containing protein [Elusimicrobium simillimum]|uniref:hypothetical protein n=1 Tax=Elusimicrobium simillimum TaxID=3143438 RepID=UPI003C7019EB
MKLSLKWFVCFAATALYVIIMGGLFFYNLFNFMFDHKLQNEIAEEVRSRASVMAHGLASQPGLITFDELQLMNNWIRTDDRIQGIIYLNSDASIRWHRDGSLIKKTYDDARAEDIFATGAVVQAFNRGVVKTVMYGNGNYYDMAFPLRAAQNELIGVVNIQVSRVSAKQLVNDALVKYAYSTFIIMILMGGILYIFIYAKIVSPLVNLRGAVETVSLKDLKLNFKNRNDEIGDVASAVTELLGRVKKEFKGIESQSKKKKDVEQLWWKALLAVAISKGSRALVVDNDNNIMFANFEISVKKDGPLHLLDIFDGQQSQIIEIIGKAMDTPGKVYKGEASVGDGKFIIRAVQLPSAENNARTMIVLEPEK